VIVALKIHNTGLKTTLKALNHSKNRSLNEGFLNGFLGRVEFFVQRHKLETKDPSKTPLEWHIREFLKNIFDKFCTSEINAYFCVH
jgi:hypothetical protein